MEFVKKSRVKYAKKSRVNYLFAKRCSRGFFLINDKILKIMENNNISEISKTKLNS